MYFKFLWTSLFVLSFLPTKVGHVVFVPAHKVLKIVAPKAEPPRIAFDDLRWQKSSDLTDLKSIRTSQVVKLGEIEINTKEKPLLFLQARRVQAEGFTIYRQDILALLEQEKKQMQAEQVNQEWLQSLTPAQRARVTVAQEKHRTLENDWNLPTAAENLKNRFDEVSENSVIKKLDGKASPEVNKIFVAAQTPDGWKTREEIQRAGVEKKEDSASPTTQILTGTWEVKGLPVAPGYYHYEVRRFEDGIPKEQGKIEYQPNRWTISVPSMEGYLAIQAFDSKGNIIGEGRRRLATNASGIVEVTSLDDRISGSPIAFNDVRGPRMVSKNVLGQKCIAAKVLLASFQTEVNTDSNCQYEMDNVHHDSWSLVRMEDPKYSPTLNLVGAGEQKSWPLLRKTMVAALQNLVRDQRTTSEYPETGSVVWGQIVQDGKPLAGIQIEPEMFSNHKAVYFNELLLPDASLKGTSTNGYFAILDLPEGFHALRASAGNEYISHVNVVVEDNTVSIANLENSLQLEPFTVKVFDAFSGEPQKAQIEMQSLKNEIDVNGMSQIFLPSLKRHNFMHVKPLSDKYVASLQIYNEADDFIHAILVESNWLRDLQMRSMISMYPSASTTVGFVENAAFDVYLTHEENYSNQNIVYFDAQGRRAASGVPGGGFVLFNVPEGVQSVVVISKDTGKIFSQVLPSDSGAVSVLKFRY